MIYLDTHVVIWLYNSDWRQFSPAALQRIENDELRISQISILELELLEEIGRLGTPVQELISTLQRDYQMAECEHPFQDIRIAAAWLRWTRDPFDRLICGNALAAGGDLLTRDETILKNFPNAVW
ncbi:MAG: PIN domain-containing protein [Acidobacteria bacterium]|nr:PIN domain-containing protein [Acidobacteriota bacterium]